MSLHRTMIKKSPGKLIHQGYNICSLPFQNCHKIEKEEAVMSEYVYVYMYMYIGENRNMSL